MHRYLHLFCFPALAFLILTTTPARYLVNDTEPVISKTTLPRHSTGSAAGDNMMQYRGFTVSYVLQELSDVPVEYLPKEDPRIDFEYHYPDLSTPEARRVAIRALADFVGAQIEEVRDPAAGFVLEASSEFGKIAPDDPSLAGVNKRVENGKVTATRLSLSELADLLNEYRKERFVAPEDDSCCATVLFKVKSSVKQLEESLLETARVKLRSGADVVTGLRVTP